MSDEARSADAGSAKDGNEVRDTRARPYPTRKTHQTLDRLRLAEFSRQQSSGTHRLVAWRLIACDPELGIGKWRGKQASEMSEFAAAKTLARFMSRSFPLAAEEARQGLCQIGPDAIALVGETIRGFPEEEKPERRAVRLKAAQMVLESVGAFPKGGNSVNVATSGPVQVNLLARLEVRDDADRH